MLAKCPLCGKSIEFDTKKLPGNFPFCSDRCKLVDLGRWIDGDYAIPGPPAPTQQTTTPSEEDDEEE